MEMVKYIHQKFYDLYNYEEEYIHKSSELHDHVILEPLKNLLEEPATPTVLMFRSSRNFLVTTNTTVYHSPLSTANPTSLP